MGQHHAVSVQEESAQCDADSTVLCQFSSSAPDVVQCQTGDICHDGQLSISVNIQWAWPAFDHVALEGSGHTALVFFGQHEPAVGSLH